MKKQAFDCNVQLCGRHTDLCASCGRTSHLQLATTTTKTASEQTTTTTATTPAERGQLPKAQREQIISISSGNISQESDRSLSTKVAAWQRIAFSGELDGASARPEKCAGLQLNLGREKDVEAARRATDALTGPLEEEEERGKRRAQQEGGEDVDGGYAWIILAAMFLINASTFGTARAYGLIFEKLARQDEQGRVEAALPFTIMGAVENMAGPLAGYLLARSDSWRLTVLAGSALLTTSHLLAALYTSLLGQTLTIGLMCGLGLSLITISSFQINNAYFVRYRSRAFGLGLTGAVFGTLYITPVCQYILDNCTTSACYLMLSIILFPNVPLSLLLRPKRQPPVANANAEAATGEKVTPASRQEISDGGCASKSNNVKLWQSIKQVIRTPHFHLIWPTQLLFCWFNFVYGMIIVDFGFDRGLEAEQCSQLIPIWALGQLVGRVVLGSLVDLKIISYRCFTIVCFGFISAASWALISIKSGPNESWQIPLLAFIISVFVALLYILFNGLMFSHMHQSLTALSLGISSFAGSCFLLPRANVIGYYRDQVGSYDPMLNMFASVSLLAALMWLIMPEVFAIIEHWKMTREEEEEEQCQVLARSRTSSLDAESDSSVTVVASSADSSANNEKSS